MPSKYNHRRVSPKEFRDLMRAGGMKMNDFLYATGRKLDQIDGFLNATSSSFIPTMGDVMILELVARGMISIDDLIAVADDYSEGPTTRDLLMRRKIADPNWRKPERK